MKDLKSLLQKILIAAKRYAVMLCFIIFAAMYGYLAYASGQQAAQEPSEAEISERFKGVKRPKVDESAAATLQRLEDQSIEVQALFNDARSNPFAE